MTDIMSFMLSPKMASKRPSAADTIFPPKKRALYEHMKLHGIDKYSSNEIAANGIIHSQENLGMCGIKLPVNIEIAQSENFSRRRSDSLHSHVSSNSDNTETGSSGSRETSPCTIQSMFDHQTPERNPITSLEGLKSDISKPLFPPSDSDSSMVDSEGHLSPDNSMIDKQDRVIDNCFSEEVRSSKEMVDYKRIPEKHKSNTFQGSESRSSDSFKNTVVPSDNLHKVVEDGEKHTSVKQKQSEVYMGPMVSLLNRFNAEAAQCNVGLKIKEQFSLEGMSSLVQLKSSINQIPVINHPQSQPLISKSDQSQILTEKNDKVPRGSKSCHICNKEFTSRANLNNHMKSHESKSIPCWVCKEQFQSAENLNAHMKIEHKGENPYKCEHCSREFTQFNNLRRHMRVHREKVFKCNLCNREFNEEFYLKMHMGTHTGKRVYSCGVCGAGFPSSHDLKMHVKTHSPSLLHTCDVCGKSFSKACVLRQHKKGHSGERPHKCDKCEKTFIHRHHLTMHMKSHVDEKRLRCNICQKEFSQHSHLYKHLRAHEDMKKYGMDLDSVQKMKNDELNSAQKIAISQDSRFDHKSVSQIVNQDSVSINDTERNDNQSRKRDRIGSGETQKQRRRYVSHGSQNPSPGIIKVPLPVSSSSNNRYQLPSMAHAFTHNMARHPSVQFSQDVSHNYLHGSPAQPYSPLFNPMLGNRVPAQLPGYRPYNQLYRNYSEQMQTYYKNMYMMQYMAQNALLQKGQVEGHTFQNQESLPQKQNESKTVQKSTECKRWLMEPKVIEGVERLESEQKCDDKDSASEDLVRDVMAQSDSDENSELDVVTMTNEQDQENPLLYTDNSEISEHQENNEVTVREGNVFSEEHEIAQELLKMSAGTEWSKRAFVEEEGLKTVADKESERNEIAAKGLDMKKGDGRVDGINFSHCINDIIERTIRNSNMLSESVYTSKSQNMKSYDSSLFDNVARLGSELSVAIPKSEDQTFKAVDQHDQERNNIEQMTGQEEAIVSVDSSVISVNRNNESQASPLQKLEMFVTSEENDFNKVETVEDMPQEIVPDFNGYFTEEISKFESVNNENNHVGNLEGDSLETGGNFLKLLKGNNEVKKGKNVPNETSVEESLEMRLAKIRQFADIGMKFGNIVNEGFESKSDNKELDEENKEEGNLEDTNNDRIEDTSNDRTGTENKDIEFNEGKVVNGGDEDTEINRGEDENEFDIRFSDKCETTDNVPGYFDDSLEDRQLEIVENDSFRGEQIEKHTDDVGSEYKDVKRDFQGQLKGSEETRESEEKLNNSGEGYSLTENEFLTHISQINVSKEANEIKNGFEVVDNSYKGNTEGTDVAVEQDGKGFVQMTGCEESEETNLRTGKDNIHQLRELRNVGTVLELRKECISENITENGAIDLRTERKMNKRNDKDACFVNIVHDISSKENLPIDLSLSRRWNDESGSENARECKNDRINNGSCENGSPSLLSCGLCRMKFNNVPALQSHQMEHAKDIGYRCSICKKSFTGAFELQCHMFKHRISETLAQNQVSSYLNNNLNCIEKSASRFREQNDSLNKENQEIAQTKLSQRSKIEEKQYCCEYCDKAFILAEQLKEHLSVHNASKKPYVCNICRRAFVHRHNLNRHKMSHNSKSFKCDSCQRSFKESFYLQMHMKTHEEENYHKCQICGENVSKSEIWQHTNQHLGNMTENPTYEQIGNRVNEILREQDINVGGAAGKNDASGIPPNLSQFGNDLRKTKLNEFSTNDRALNLKRENVENMNVSKTTKTVKHVNVFQNKENSRKGALVLHEDNDLKNLRNSEYSILQLFECHICKNVLSTKHELENHMGIHSGLRPYVCQTCGRAFKKSKGLKTHEKIHLESSFKE